MKITILAAAALLVSVGLVRLFHDRTFTDMQNKISLPNVQSVPSANWAALAGKKIFFAHMSVGYNILDGLRTVIGENPGISLNIIETSEPIIFAQPGLYHAELGYNAQPYDKLKSFETLVNSANIPPDIALMKFCYVDITAQTDAEQLFDAYQAAFARLQKQFPKTLFLHCTVPLTSEPPSLKQRFKQRIKAVLGKYTITDDNAARMRFNAMLREAFPSRAVFDLALAEAADRQGFLCCKMKNKTPVPFLRREFTSDGGHLNADGAKQAGEQLLIALSKAAAQQSGL